MILEHVEGKNKGDVKLYVLSTCVWCRKTKQLLNDIGVDYFFVYVDLLDEEEKQDVVREIEKWNPDSSFPTMVINNNECIVGFKPEDIRKKLG